MNHSSSPAATPRRGAALSRLAVSLLLAAACGGPSVAAAPAVRGTTVIPWVNVPSTPESLASSAHAARQCTAADLEIVVGRAGAFHGQATQELNLRDRGTEACFLAGAPQARLPIAGGRAQVGDGGFGAQRVDLAPGQSATLLIGTPAICPGVGQPKIASSVQLTLPDGESVIAGGTWVDTACGAAAVIAFDALAPPTAAPGPLSAVNGVVAAPPAAARGSVLAYRVTLRNPSPSSIALAPCPAYTETLGDGGATTVQHTLLLNCRAAGSIAANAGLTYQMKLAVPASVPTGLTKLSWKLEVPGGLALGAVISVT
jgi:hypothetical protein